MAAAASCPWCNAPRSTGPSCPRCGANYAKAELIRTQGHAQAVAVEEPVAVEQAVAAVLAGPDDRAVEDPVLEWKLCVAAIPAALGLAFIFHLLTPGMQRIFFAMPVHDLGHAL